MQPGQATQSNVSLMLASDNRERPATLLMIIKTGFRE